MNGSDTFSFFGRIHPERTATHLTEVTVQQHSPIVDFEMDLFVQSSQILTEVRTYEEVDNLATLKNLVESSISSLSDPVAFIDGKNVSIEISAVITPSGHKRVFGIEHDYIGESLSQNEVSEEWPSKVFEAYKTDASPYLQRAFRDYRLALEHAEDTGFYCFRSVESLRQFYDNGSDADSWEKLRNETGISRETIEEDIQKYSKKRRHGDIYSLTAEERRDILEATWEVLDSFINSIIE